MKAFLTLQNGRVFEGESFGAQGDTMGELVFTTAMTGYNETLTDPSYCGQSVIQTFPLIGNYGVITPDFESKGLFLNGYIVREWCDVPSNFRCEGDIDKLLKEKNIVGLCGIDTRELTRIVREYGVMNAKITTEKPDVEKIVEELKNFKIKDPVKKVSVRTTETEQPKNKKYRVVLWDFGAKKSIKTHLLERNCEVMTVPESTTADEILQYNPDGVMLSNGPGDPEDNETVISELKKLCKSDKPIFGICLGHQLLALAHGAKTEKLKYGHRGGNQPVRELSTGRVFISTQNHGYAVVSESLPESAHMSYQNANDGTCEGVEYDGEKIFSVQFHPEASGGPLDTSFLFDKFIKFMED